MKIKIVSDGTSLNTRVVTETGEEIEGVLSIEWSVSLATHISTAKIEFINVGAEIGGELVES